MISRLIDFALGTVGLLCLMVIAFLMFAYPLILAGVIFWTIWEVLTAYE